MLESFYKYVVNELLIHYFEQHPILSGNRFYIIIENKNHRDGLIKAMKSSNYAQPITIENIYNGIDYNIKEEGYNTFHIAPLNSVNSLIIGNSDDATEDYLTTLRNAVCNPKSPYSNYGILYILSNNRLESLTTASVNMQNVGMPLNTSYIKDNIEVKIKNCLMNDNEKLYLKDHLSRIATRIGDGGYTLFDFKDILGVLQKGTLKDQFTQLGYFKDDVIYDMFFEKSEKDMSERINQNSYLFNQISDILAQTDGQDRRDRLSKILDDKLANELTHINDTSNIDFLTVMQSIEKKNASATLAFEDIKITEENSHIQILKRTKGNDKKKSSTYVLICDPTNENTTRIRLSFSTDIRGLASEGQTNGRFLYLEVGEETKAISVGKENNIHKFFIKKIPVIKDTFDSIHSYFTINKKGVITIDVPEDIMSLSLGCGNTIVQPATLGPLEWNDDYLLNVPLESNDDSDKVKLSVSFKNQKVDFVFNLGTARIQPKSPMSLFELIWTKELKFRESVNDSFSNSSFSKIYCEEEEYSVHDSFRKYLRLEKQMIEEQHYAMAYSKDEGEYRGIYLDLPENIKIILSKIFEYFKREKTVPSLCYIDDELEFLYKQYLFEISVQTINTIPETRTLNK